MAFDYAGILEYIQGAMTKTQMHKYSGSLVDSRPQWGLEAEGGVLFELCKNQIQQEENGLFPRKQLPGLDALIQHLQKQFNSLFNHISETQRRNVHFGAPTYLGLGHTDRADVIMIPEVCTIDSRNTIE